MMRFRAVEVENIRSYVKERVEFPKGSIVLAGDVGAGKSSLLLAIEFALFGIRGSDLPGEALLRRGTNHGKVKVEMKINDKNITIVRELTRQGDSVRQDDGYIVINGKEYPKSPRELKATVLQLLGYPMELLRKRKSRIFRYTVYTPQESMNEIMTEMDEEERLNTLRKVFRVDKYKRIKENIDDFLTELRRKRRVLKPTFQKLDAKQEKREELEEKLSDKQEELKELKEEKQQETAKLEKLKKEKEKLKEQLERYNTLTTQLEKVKTNLENKQEQLTSLKEEIQTLEEQIKEIESLSRPTETSKDELSDQIKSLRAKRDNWLTEPEKVSETVKELEEEKTELEENIQRNKDTITEFNTKIEGLQENIEKLKGETGTCPLCGQPMDEQHRKTKLKEFRENSTSMKDDITQLKEAIKEHKKEKQQLEEKKNEHIDKALAKIKKKSSKKETQKEDLINYQEKQERKNEYQERHSQKQQELNELKDTIEQQKERKKDIRAKRKKLADVKQQNQQLEEKLENQRNTVNQLENKITGKQKDKQHLEEKIRQLQENITDMKKRKQFWTKLGTYHSWLDNHFNNLIDTIETQFLARMQKQFNPVFRKWFNFLIDDEGLNARIDRKFTPIILQEGYQAPYSTLSGGERASVALAYRLALNKVINSQIENIQTKDIIILDEPTDGFSDQQLDKMRDIIYRLDIPQIIIVSHERKVKDYVEHTIEIQKEEGISQQVG